MHDAPLTRITRSPIDEAEVRKAVDAPECGAVVLFSGVVRDHDGGQPVSQLEYEAHPEAQEFLAECVRQEQERSGLRLAAVHRVGSLAIGDVALVVAASSSHRPEAFRAVEHLTQRIKDEVPIWKRQHFASGVSEWVGL